MMMAFPNKVVFRMFLVSASVGFALISIQSVLIRELMATFGGNELTLAITLACWLIASALGSLCFTLFQKQTNHIKYISLANSFLYLTIFAFFSIGIARAIPFILSFETGVYPSFLKQFLGALIVTMPVGLIGGWIFPVLCSILEIGSYGVSIILGGEALGFLIGGAIFAFFLAEEFNPYAQIALVILPILICGITINFAEKVKNQMFFILKYAALVILILSGSFYFDKPTEYMRLNFLGISKGKNLISSNNTITFFNTRFQKVTITKNEDQYSLYCNNHFSEVFPDIYTSKILAHFLIAQNPKPQSVLIIGGNPFDLVNFLRMYTDGKITHIEQDDRMMSAIRNLNCYDKLEGSFVEINQDPIAFLQNTQDTFDVIVIKSPNPASLLINRLYTVEFYVLASKRLSKNGFIYTALEVPPELYESSALKLVNTIFYSLQQVFAKVLFTYGTHIQFLAANTDTVISIDPQVLYKRLVTTGKPSDFPPQYFLNADEIAPDKINLLQNKLNDCNIKKINSVYKPIAVFYQNQLFAKYIDEKFSISNIKNSAGFIAIVICILIASLLAVIFWKPSSKEVFPKVSLVIFLFLAGLFGMIATLILIVLFQSFYGYIYSAIAFISALFMFGFFAGSVLGGRINAKAVALKLLVLISILKMSFLLILLVVPSILTNYVVLLYGLIVLAGVLTALCYVLFLKLVMGYKTADKAYCSELPGIANFADLAGGAIGALTFSTIFLPLIGIKGIAISFIILEILVTLPILIYSSQLINPK